MGHSAAGRIMSMNHRICILYNNSLQCVRVRVGHDIPQLSDVSRQIILIPIALLFWKFPTLHCWWNGRCATRIRPVKSPRLLWIWITLIIQSSLVCWITGVWSTVWRKSVSFMRVQYIIRRVVTLKKNCIRNKSWSVLRNLVYTVSHCFFSFEVKHVWD